MATEVIESHFKFSTKEVICTALEAVKEHLLIYFEKKVTRRKMA
jgi:hypothetical protein